MSDTDNTNPLIEDARKQTREILEKVKEINADPSTSNATRIKLLREILLPLYKGVADMAEKLDEP